MPTPRVAVLGLGAMGCGMAKNLHQHGLLTAVWNRTFSKALAWQQEQLGDDNTVRIVDHPEDTLLLADIILLCVSADDDVREIVQQLLPCFTAKHLLIDASTISSVTAQAIDKQISAQTGIHRFLDAPVSGGVEGAQQGTLVAMVGGPASLFAEAEPVFEAIAKNAVHLGEVGAGQATKAVNQIMAAGINQAVCEAMKFAQVAGLDITKTVQVVGSGAAGNWFVNHRGLSMTQGDYDTGFKVRLHHKDLAICQRMAATLGVTLPLSELTLDDYAELIENGFGEEDISALYRIIQAA